MTPQKERSKSLIASGPIMTQRAGNKSSERGQKGVKGNNSQQRAKDEKGSMEKYNSTLSALNSKLKIAEKIEEEEDKVSDNDSDNPMPKKKGI
jgi:hypothetical protein